jgi:6-phosphogluconolactonase
MICKLFSTIILFFVSLLICGVLINAKSIPGKGIKDQKSPDDSTKIKSDNYLLYIGTYTPKGTGIYIYSMNPETGNLKYLGVSPSSLNPSYLVIQPNKKFLYSANETDSGYISSFSIKDSSTLEFINSVPSNGASPCYVSIDNSGKYLLASNYNSGSVTSVPINPDGSLGNPVSTIRNNGKSINKQRQSSPHAHSIIPALSGNLIYSADLGTDLIYCYKIDTTSGQLSIVSKTHITAGSGPRHLAFHPNKKWLYELNELKGTVNVFMIDSVSGTLFFLQSNSLLKVKEDGAPAADIHITSSGRFLYASVRDPENIIAIFSINQQDGSLTSIGNVATGGKTPRNFVIDPSGKFLLVANQNSDNIITFRIESKSGKLKQVGSAVNVPSPTCIKFLDQ